MPLLFGKQELHILGYLKPEWHESVRTDTVLGEVDSDNAVTMEEMHTKLDKLSILCIFMRQTI